MYFACGIELATQGVARSRRAAPPQRPLSCTRLQSHHPAMTDANSWPEGDAFNEELFALTKPSSSKVNMRRTASARRKRGARPHALTTQRRHSQQHSQAHALTLLVVLLVRAIVHL
jgi:hypothetical protein